jgi:hypothetical protein
MQEVVGVFVRFRAPLHGTASIKKASIVKMGNTGTLHF